MKCQKCEKPATFHITDLTGDELLALHLCPDCAKHYLQTDETPDDAPVVSGVLQQQLKLEQAGRLGCPHDYVFFGTELEPLLINVHGESKHVGKHPKRGVHDTESQTELIRLRRQMKEVVEQEDYEKATELRDRIKQIEEDGQVGN
jgi:protein arginine kinase activator